MDYRSLRQAARRQPFEPFRLTLTTGEKYDIRHPDLIMVGRQAIIIGLPLDDKEPVFDETIKIDLFHIVSIAELPKKNKAKQ